MEGVVSGTPQQNGETQPNTEEKTVAGKNSSDTVKLLNKFALSGICLAIIDPLLRTTVLSGFDY